MTTTEKGQIAAELFADEETGMVWQPVESSQISEVGYDIDTATLGIRFKAGKRSAASEYHYANVPGDIHRALMTAESVGTYFGQNIKSRPSLYPFTKIEADPTPPNGSTSKKTVGTKTETSSPSTTTDGATIDTPSTALAVIDTMADDLLFTPGAITDAQLAAGRDWYLTEAKKYDISTEKARTEFKRFARPLQKLRTGIEARAKELTGATKRKIAAIDAEKRRLVGIVGGIEDEVLAPLTSWEAEEEARKIRLAGIVKSLGEHVISAVYPNIASIEETIAELEAFDLSTMQEYKIGAESAIAASLKVLKPELERRKEIEAQAAELAKLRAEAAEREQRDRIEAAARITREDAEKQAAWQAEIDRRKIEDAEQRIKDAAAQAERDREAAVEAERKRVADAAKREQEAAEARAADAKHRQTINSEAAHGIVMAVAHLNLSNSQAMDLVVAIAKGLIPHITIQY